MNTLQELINVHVQNRNSGYSTTYRGVGYDSTEYTNKKYLMRHHNLREFLSIVVWR